MSKSSNIPDHPDVMISSTYTDLAEHRRAVIDALLRLSLFPNVMEFDSAKANKTVIDSSFDMLSKAKAYIGIISHRYGSVPKDAKRNPDNLSITELEYKEALRLSLPVYIFLMSNNHPVKPAEVETSGALKRKLQRLRKEVKERSIYAEFSSIEELKSQVLQSMSAFKETYASSAPSEEATDDDIKQDDEAEFPSPPQFVAVPNFIPGHDFVGRRAELNLLDDWAARSEKIMLIESIGGQGKSSLAWEWIKGRSHSMLPALAGAFWYSFYQGGANMDGFSANALAYITEKPLAHFNKMKSFDLFHLLIKELRKRQFLIVLDGLERVLVAYYRIDASQVRDDKVSSANNGRACIRPSDESLLREFISNHLSKIIITSRLIPSIFTNRTHKILTDVCHYRLGGLHPNDALRMMKSTGVYGNDDVIQSYLRENFDNHPLMVGIVAGLVNDYFHGPGNFDLWVKDKELGAVWEKEDLPQGRKNILATVRTAIVANAIKGLESNARRLLSSIAMLNGPIPFETVLALNPFKRKRPNKYSKQFNKGPEEQYDSSLPELIDALQDLEQRGLLQWDRKENTYDLHPVVRGYASDMLEANERMKVSNELVDHFQSKPPDRYEDAKSLVDVQQSINIFRALIQANRFNEAATLLMGSFTEALIFSIEAYHDILTFIESFFPNGFKEPSIELTSTYAGTYLLNTAGIALRKTHRFSLAREAYISNLSSNLRDRDKREVYALLINLALCCFDSGQIASSSTAFDLALELAQVIKDNEAVAITNLHLMALYRRIGRFDKATAGYETFKRLQVPTKRHLYRIGDVEAELCWLNFYQNKLTYKELENAKSKALYGGKETRRSLARLEGELALQLGNTDQAILSFETAIEISQRVGIIVNELEGRLALARAITGQIGHAIDICGRLSDIMQPPHVELAAAYLQIGDKKKARYHALQGYRWAWSEGPPYSRYWELMCCRSVLQALQESEPELPVFNPSTLKPFPFEKDIRGLIRRLKDNAKLGRFGRYWN
jgi:tetratricopeptide (TPR) repeat protein